MHSVVVTVRIPADELLRFYAGQATEVLATALDGRTVRFPVRVLRPFVTEDGVAGTFQLRFDHNRKFVDITRVGRDRIRSSRW